MPNYLNLVSERKENKTNGPGLGLTFCKSMIECLGGKIWFNSVINEGTTFYIKFPVRIATKTDLDSQQIAMKSTESALIEKLDRLQKRADDLARQRQPDVNSSQFQGNLS